MSILFRPQASVAADFIPFYWNGAYHLFYLRDWRNPQQFGEGTPWHHLVTHDFVTFEDWGEALPRGSESEQDLYVFTGCVFEHQGVFHIYYTGHNPHLRKAGKPEQAVMHATSTDLRYWVKQPHDTFFAPENEGYEPHDWRDPFIYFDERYQQYAMLLAARKTGGPSRYRGCVALATSPDLKVWTVQKPFWNPELYFTHECPDLFRIGDWWYIVYSEFSARSITHYRMARSLDGPWIAPTNDSFDGRPYYAAKTASDGRRRFSFGWLATRDREADDGHWQWGGDLVVHEVMQQPNGTLSVRMPDSIRQAFGGNEHASKPQPVLGKWDTSGTVHRVDALDRNAILCMGELPDECLIQLDITLDHTGSAGEFGVLLRADAAFDRYYELRLEPAMQRVVLDRWPRPGDQPMMIERPLAMAPHAPGASVTIHLRLLISGTCLVVYANDEVALSCRMYQHRDGGWGVFAREGQARFANMRVMGRSSVSRMRVEQS